MEKLTLAVALVLIPLLPNQWLLLIPIIITTWGFMIVQNFSFIWIIFSLELLKILL